MYEYGCRVSRVVDGDTLDVVIDVGFRLTTVQRVRLLGVDTPERNQPGFTEAKDFVVAWLADLPVIPWPCVIETHKTDNFGRWLAVVHDSDMGSTLNDALVAAGHG